MTLLVLGSIAAGLVAGVIAGLLGVGGGLVLVPAILFLFHLDGLNPAFAMPLAVGTSLATIIVTNSVATWGHHQRQAVRWDMVKQYAPAILIGAWLGSHLAIYMTGSTLRLCFGLFEIAVGLKMILPAKVREQPPKWHPSEWAHSLLALVIGALSSLFGIGGGTLTVPVLNLLGQIPIHQAVGTSSAIGVFISMAGTLGFIHAGWNQPGLPSTTVGFVVSPIFFAIITGTLLTTPLGVKLAHSLNADHLGRWFGTILLLVGGKLLWD